MKQAKYTIYLLLILSLAFAVSNTNKKQYSGGQNTVFDVSNRAFGRSSPALNTEQLRKFTFGNKIFNVKWSTFPSSVKTLDGLGPLFNRHSCSSCHVRDGRGNSFNENGRFRSLLIRFSQRKNQMDVTHPIYGNQLSDRAILNVTPEASINQAWEYINGKYPDGTEYQLRKPNYTFKFNYGNPGKYSFSARVPQAVFGLGLLEAIAKEDILQNQDIDDKNNDGISGKANLIYNVKTKQYDLGRFGWKASVSSIKQQNANAAVGDIGITNPLHIKENHLMDLKVKQADLDMNDKQLDALTFYVQSLAVPARRRVNSLKVQQGEKTFYKLDCAKCHIPSFTTAKHQLSFLTKQNIQPFTDLLLHDMGEGLADNRSDNNATGREWRTAPLWGLGLIKMVNKHTELLHDARARNIEEAILWHGGEAEISKQKFKNLSKQERELVIHFLESL